MYELTSELPPSYGGETITTPHESLSRAVICAIDGYEHGGCLPLRITGWGGELEWRIEDDPELGRLYEMYDRAQIAE